MGHAPTTAGLVRSSRLAVGAVMALAGLCAVGTVDVASAGPARADSVVDGCTIVSHPTPTDSTRCPGADLSNADLSGVDLSYADLSGATFAYCTDVTANEGCRATDLQNADLDSADLSGAVFEDFYFPGMARVYGISAPMTGVMLTRADLSGVDLDYLDLSSIALTGANLSRATLATAQITGTALTDVNFTDADLSGTEFADTDLTGVTFTGADLASAGFVDTVLDPPDQAVQATSGHGAVVSWTAPPGLPGLSQSGCSPASGSEFAVGTTSGICTLTDDHGQPAHAYFTVTVQISPMEFTTTSLPPATVGASYSASLVVTGGFAPYSFKLVRGAGRLPAGLTLDKSNGVISGTPNSRSVTTTFTIEALDTKTPRSKGSPASQRTVERTYTITVTH